MATFAERIYQLGSDALAEQERQVAELRSRGSTLVAAGGVIVSLLAPGVLRGGGPNYLGESVATGIGLSGAPGCSLR